MDKTSDQEAPQGPLLVTILEVLDASGGLRHWQKFVGEAAVTMQRRGGRLDVKLQLPEGN